MSLRRRGETDREDRRRTLVLAADELLRELPYLDVRVEDVAKSAGVAKGTVFLYFRNKEALALAVLRARMEQVCDYLEAGADRVKDPKDLVSLMIETHQTWPETARMLGLYSAVLQYAAPAEEVSSFLARIAERVGHLAAIVAPAMGRPVEEVARMIDLSGMAIVSHALTGRDAQLPASASAITHALSPVT